MLIVDSEGKQVAAGATDANGYFGVELLEYSADSGGKSVRSPYSVVTGDVQEVVVLYSNREVVITLK